MRLASSVLAILAVGAMGLYDASRTDVTLVSNKADFSREVTKFDGIAMVEFYAPWCGHCKNLAPEWEKAATALKGVAKVVAVDATAAGDLAQKYGVQGYPTIKVFGANKRSPTDYQGGRTAKDIVSAAQRAVSDLVSSRIGGGSSGGGSKSRKSSSSGKRSSEPGGGRNVVELTESNFDSLVLESDDLWLVEFYAPWCGHCKSAAPAFSEAADQLKDEVKVGAVDATVAQSLASRFGVQGFPTFKLFPAGSKTDKSAVPYEGPRETQGFVQFATEWLQVSGGADPVTELVSEEVFRKKCRGQRVCLVAFLADLRDEDAKQRRERLDMLEEAAKKDKKAPVRFLWTVTGLHPDLEKKLGVDLAPSMVAISAKKKAFAKHAGTFDTRGVNKFVTGIVSGRIPVAPIPGDAIPTINNVQPWDGKDAEVEQEEEFSLDDIMDEDVDL